MLRRITAAALIAVGLLASGAGVAAADEGRSYYGPGESSFSVALKYRLANGHVITGTARVR